MDISANNIIVKFKKLHPKAEIPKFATDGAACMDLVATEIEVFGNENKWAIIKLGFATKIPEGYKACFSPRSSFTHKNWIMSNSPAQIDSDYVGEWMIKMEAVPIDVTVDGGDYGSSYYDKLVFNDFPYKKGDRVAQCWLEKVIDFKFEEVDELSDTGRGSGGFGSTGA